MSSPMPLDPAMATSPAANPIGQPPQSAPSPGSLPPSTEQESVSFEQKDRLLDRRLYWGLGALVLWFLVFATGILIPSKESRIRLGWKPAIEQLDELRKLPKIVADMEKEFNQLKVKVSAIGDPEHVATDQTTEPTPPSPEIPPPSAAATPPPIPSPPPSPAPTASLALVAPIDPNSSGSFGDFLIAMFSFTPLNVAILCMLAAFIGGCTENTTEIERLRGELKKLSADGGSSPDNKAAISRRLAYLTEHPGHSAIRGLVVYLIIMSGLFIIGAPPLGDASILQDPLGQYVKLAALLSFFGYLAGYDPTVFTTMLNFGAQRLNSAPGDGASKS